LKSKISTGTAGKIEAEEVRDVHPVFRANPFMIEEGVTLVRGEKRPTQDTLKRIDLHLTYSAGKPLFAEIKWTSIDENQVAEYRRLISEKPKNSVCCG
jgi:hypothetical protein